MKKSRQVDCALGRKERNRSVVERAAMPAVTLKVLVDAITEDNRHSEMLIGEAVGKERL